ncbi:tubulin binding cofactor A [Auriculariales sp. MPI-PUGE-AT-0066]|nr:tubulin binding cofactor A [Auriculariales sp. MPI-PUGE-AT-0066]
MSEDNKVQAQLKRQLKIKTGIVQRYLKELALYKNETEDMQRKVDKLLADGVEGWDLKNARNMLEESKKMVPDTQGRLEKAVAELRDVTIQAKLDTGMHESEEYLKADEALEEAHL